MDLEIVAALDISSVEVDLKQQKMGVITIKLNELPDLDDLPRIIRAVAKQQLDLFRTRMNPSNLDNAASNYAMTVELTDAGHPDMPMYILDLAMVQLARFDKFRSRLDLDRAVLIATKAAELADDGHTNKPTILWMLSLIHQVRFVYLSDLSDLDMAISNVAKVVELTEDGHPAKPMYLEASRKLASNNLGTCRIWIWLSRM
jgi:hypothetical protein